MKLFNPYLIEYKSLFDNDPKLSPFQKSVINGTVSDVDRFENAEGKSIVDMRLNQFEKIREGWLRAQTDKPIRRKLLCLSQYLEWYKSLKGDVIEYEQKQDFLNNMEEYRSYRENNYLGIFIKDFDILFRLGNVYKNIDGYDMTADPCVVSCIFCYSSGNLKDSGLIRSCDVASDYSSFTYNGKEYEIFKDAREYLRLYDTQKLVITNDNKEYYKSNSDYFIKLFTYKNHIGEKDDKPYAPNSIINRLKAISQEYNNKYNSINLNYTCESIYMSNYFEKASHVISSADSDLKWREYFSENPVKNYNLYKLIELKNAYNNQKF